MMTIVQRNFYLGPGIVRWPYTNEWTNKRGQPSACHPALFLFFGFSLPSAHSPCLVCTVSFIRILWRVSVMKFTKVQYIHYKKYIQKFNNNNYHEYPCVFFMNKGRSKFSLIETRNHRMTCNKIYQTEKLRMNKKLKTLNFFKVIEC